MTKFNVNHATIKPIYGMKLNEFDIYMNIKEEWKELSKLCIVMLILISHMIKIKEKA